MVGGIEIRGVSKEFTNSQSGTVTEIGRAHV